MKLLFDQNISYRITKSLLSYFPECKHVIDCKLNNAEDSEIWKYAKENRFAIVTFDSDFYEISLIKGHPPKIIWIRTGNLSTDDLAGLLIMNQDLINDFLNNKAFDEVACIEMDKLR